MSPRTRRSLLATAAEHAPDVVVTDIKMPPSFQLEGIDCAHSIRERHPDTGVVVLSAHDDEEYAIALLGKGHSGLAYLLKDRIAQGDELARAIREVRQGGSVVDPSIAERLAGRAESPAEDRIVLDMMAQGLGYEEMAAHLGTTQEAVDGHVTALFRRMAGDDGAGTGLLGEFKKLHAAVVEQSATASSLKSYVPSQFVDALARGGDAASQRELEVTVLFSDIRGFSSIAERLTARDIAEVVGRHLGAMAEVIAEHGGTIDKFQGDAVMAVFGAPEPTPDHAERALRCALAMQDRQGQLNAMGWGTDAVDGLHVGIGLNTGVVMAGAVGGGGRLEYTVIGDAVNVAQRLQSEADGGEVVAAASTVAAAPTVVAESIGPRVVKGREEAGRGLPDPGKQRVMATTASITRPSRWPWIVLGVTAAFAAVGLVFVSLNGYSLLGDATNFIAFMGMGIVGALSLSRAPDNRIGWLLLWVAITVGAAFTTGEASIYAAAHGEDALAGWLAWPGNALWTLGLFPLLILLPLVFPDGRLPSPRWRWLAWAGVGISFLAFVSIGFGTATFDVGDVGRPITIANPLHVPGLDARTRRVRDLAGCSSASSRRPPCRWSSGSAGRAASNDSSSSGSRSRSSCSLPTS